MRELSAKGGRLHSPGRSRPLHQGVQRGSADTQHQRDAEHTLIAYESDLEARQIVGRSDQGNEAVGREVDVADTFAGLAEHLLKAKLNVRCTTDSDPFGTQPDRQIELIYAPTLSTVSAVAGLASLPGPLLVDS